MLYNLLPNLFSSLHRNADTAGYGTGCRRGHSAASLKHGRLSVVGYCLYDRPSLGRAKGKGRGLVLDLVHHKVTLPGVQRYLATDVDVAAVDLPCFELSGRCPLSSAVLPCLGASLGRGTTLAGCDPAAGLVTLG